MNVYDTIIRRRSIRRFKQEPVSSEILKKLVNAGRLAPSGANLQPCEYIIIQHEELVNKVFGTLKWAGYIAPEGNPKEGEQPTAYIVVLLNREKRKSGGERDAAAAIENIILTAMEEGISSCWLCSIDRTGLRGTLNIPDKCEIDSVLALGYPNESPKAVEMKDSIKYWKDGEGVLNVPKRSLEDVCFFDEYGKERI
jgi:nitroreductase